MRCIILTILIPLVFLIICAFGGSAHADMTDAEIAEANLVNLVKKHMRPAERRGDYDKRLYDGMSNSKGYETASAETQGNRRAEIRSIDGQQPAIEISQERTSLPADYMEMPTSKRDMERYNGR